MHDKINIKIECSINLWKIGGVVNLGDVNDNIENLVKIRCQKTNSTKVNYSQFSDDFHLLLLHVSMQQLKDGSSGNFTSKWCYRMLCCSANQKRSMIRSIKFIDILLSFCWFITKFRLLLRSSAF